jgi:hypothetical protein
MVPVVTGSLSDPILETPEKLLDYQGIEWEILIIIGA